MPQIKSSFILNSSQPLDLRDSLTLTEMLNKGKYDVDEGHITYCKDGDAFYKGRYFVFMPSLTPSVRTGYYREFSLQDALILPDHNALETYDATLLQTGKLVYCLSDKMMYYNRYYDGAPNTDKNDQTGWFWKLVDLSTSSYVSTSSYEWTKLLSDVDKLNNNEIKSYDSINDLIEESNKSNWVFSKGQLVYCTEADNYFYNIYTQEELTDIPDKESLKGWFGYFRLLNKKHNKPIVTEPYIKLFPTTDTNKDLRGWEIAEKNGERVYVADWNDRNTVIPDGELVAFDFYRGKIDYSDYIYFPSKYNDIEFDYVTGDLILSSLRPKVSGQQQLNRGDNYYYTSFNIDSPSHQTTPYKDLNGLDLPRITNLQSNYINFNYTLPYYASTMRSGLTKQPLLPWVPELEGDMVAEFTLLPTIVTAQQIKTPRPIKKLYIKMFGIYVEEDIKDWVKDSQGGYHTYTYNKCHRSSVDIKIKF